MTLGALAGTPAGQGHETGMTGNARLQMIEAPNIPDPWVYSSQIGHGLGLSMVNAIAAAHDAALILRHTAVEASRSRQLPRSRRPHNATDQ